MVRERKEKICRKFLCVGNWKMNVVKKEIDVILQILKEKVEEYEEMDLVVAPPFLYMQYCLMDLPDHFELAAQNCYKCSTGSFTGEVSPAMLIDIGVMWVILGHCERRQLFGETDELIAEKISHALNEGMNVIACVGETLEERSKDRTAEVLIDQLRGISAGVMDWDNMVIAYEPVWSMGTKLDVLPKEAQEAHAVIRKWFRDKVDEEVADNIRIIYGGSVNADNCRSLARQPDVDGFLVSTASLTEDFATICNLGTPV